MKRDELREAIRLQTDLDSADLPNETVDLFLREAYQRTVAMNRRWPSMETSWPYTFTGGDGTLPLAVDTAEIAAITDGGGTRLAHGDLEFLEAAYHGTTGNPEFYSVWGQSLTLWPTPTADYACTVRGWRKGSYAWLSDPALECDIDERLHIPIMHFAVALAYVQQEDPEMEQVYMSRWAQGVQTVSEDIMKPGVYRPIVLNGGPYEGVVDRSIYGWTLP